MGNYKFYKEIKEKNKRLSNDKVRTSSVRVEFLEKEDLDLINEEMIESKDLISLAEIKEEFLPSASSYNQNNELSILSNSNLSKEINSTPLLKNSDMENWIDKIKIIGITGSRGKSTTALIVHNYFQSIGKKSILYSSIMIDSPVSYIRKEEPCEIPIKNENTLLDIFEEGYYYDADYIVIEVNESTIEKGLIEGLNFFVRALTNISPFHNEEQFSPDEYIRLKESFFKNIPNEEESICVMGLTGPFTREDFNRLIKLNNRPKITYGSKYICEVRNADYSNIDILLHGLASSLNGLDLKVRVKDKSYDFNTNIIFPYNAFNFVCAIGILEAAGVFDPVRFNQVIKNMVIPGREEVIKINSRTIIIGLHLLPVLESLKPFKDSGEINNIKVVVASIGSGFISWGKEFSTKIYNSKKGKIRKFAMDYLKEYADYAYITSNDNAAEDPNAIAQELKEYLGEKIPSTIIVDRVEAIKKAIIDSKENDLIFISGRGNRRVFCESANSIKLIQDREIVEEVIYELGW